MDEPGARAFAVARGWIGAPFRAQGCDPVRGVDCVGLVWAAYAAAGRRLVRPTGYPLRGWPRARIESALIVAGFAAVTDAARPGDVALIVYPARQFHLALIGVDSLIHAHAGLRRVVEAPLDEATRSAARWRIL